MIFPKRMCVAEAESEQNLSSAFSPSFSRDRRFAGHGGSTSGVCEDNKDEEDEEELEEDDNEDVKEDDEIEDEDEDDDEDDDKDEEWEGERSLKRLEMMKETLSRVADSDFSADDFVDVLFDI